MSQPRLPTGYSDPVSFKCTCPASDSQNGGAVLLFYRYYAATPPLPPEFQHQADEPASLAAFHSNLTNQLGLGGKLRIAKEGFNITVGGTQKSIDEYIQALVSHWSLSGLDLSTSEKQKSFFKPTPVGCACVFGGVPASVLVKAEITPMGVTDYLPRDWEKIESLSPEDFHRKCWEEGGDKILIDVRNHYESRIGYFVDPVSGKEAIRPGIRRFSQWPGFVKKYLSISEKERVDGTQAPGRQIMTYCTGGIRCEKGVRWMQENMQKRDGDTVCTLKGGITAYMMWIEEEVKMGRMRPEDSLFRGRNYVFDARGSIGLELGTDSEPVSKCLVCNNSSDRLSKCRSLCCHLILVVCASCELSADPRCCESCRENDLIGLSEQNGGKQSRRPVCQCEKDRETELWGGGPQVKLSKTHEGKTPKLSLEKAQYLEINIKTFK